MGNARFFSILAAFIIIYAVILTPVQIISLGYLPPDDAKCHAAKVISGKSWQKVLVLRDDKTIDTHPGWNFILNLIHRITSWNVKGLVLFSVITLYAIVIMVPLLFIRKRESWIIAVLMALVIYSGMATRLLSGRPYLLIMAYVIFICFQWRGITDKKIKPIIMLFTIALSAASTWMQGTWYLLLLPILAFLFARQWRGALRLAACTVGGVALGAFLSGTPVLFLTSTFFYGFHVFSHIPGGLQNEEMHPCTEWWQPLIAFVAVLLVRRSRGEREKELLNSPIIFLALIGYLLGFYSLRFWSDWGLPALMVWMAMELDAVEMPLIGKEPRVRLLFSMAAAFAFYHCFVNYPSREWKTSHITWNLSPIVLNAPGWLPERGGILYNYDMLLFYDTFFLFPHAPWRYMLGFEPTMMPDDDVRTYADILSTKCSYASFEPWVRKMKAADRLALTRHPLRKPKITELEWRCFGPALWIGRLPRKGENIQ